jgi:hypothetical protein
MAAKVITSDPNQDQLKTTTEMISKSSLSLGNYVAQSLKKHGIDQLSCSVYGQMVYSILCDYARSNLSKAGYLYSRYLPQSIIENLSNAQLMAQFYIPWDSKFNDSCSKELSPFDRCLIDLLAANHSVMEEHFRKIWGGEANEEDMTSLITLSKKHPTYPRNVEEEIRNFRAGKEAHLF